MRLVHLIATAQDRPLTLERFELASFHHHLVIQSFEIQVHGLLKLLEVPLLAIHPRDHIFPANGPTLHKLQLVQHPSPSLRSEFAQPKQMRLIRFWCVVQKHLPCQVFVPKSLSHQMSGVLKMNILAAKLSFQRHSDQGLPSVVLLPRANPMDQGLPVHRGAHSHLITPILRP